MRLNIYCSFIAVFFFIYGCSEKDPNMKLKNVIREETKITYYDKGKRGYYRYDEGITTETYKRFNIAEDKIIIDTVIKDTFSVKNFDDETVALIYRLENKIQIEKIDSNTVFLIKNRKLYDDITVEEEWRLKCEIIKGSKAAFERGETIEVSEVDATEYNKAKEVLYKAKETFKWKNFNPYGFYYDPTKSKVKIDTKKHIFYIDKNKIEELLDYTIDANITLVKATK